MPGLGGDGLTGGAEWTDGQVDEHRAAALAFLHAAAEAGAALANYVEATGIEQEGGRVRGIVARDVGGGGAWRSARAWW